VHVVYLSLHAVNLCLHVVNQRVVSPRTREALVHIVNLPLLLDQALLSLQNYFNRFALIPLHITQVFLKFLVFCLHCKQFSLLEDILA